jgi:DMSO/TMAO reductase YedYZ molybdopterin-dependent catalytic subunit
MGRDGRLLTGKTAAHGQRLPPGPAQGRELAGARSRHPAEIPLHAWRLFVDGAVEDPTTLKWGAFTDLPKVALTSDIHCVTAWSRYDNRWEGVSARTLIELVQAQGRGAARHLPFLRHLHDQRAAGRLRRRRRAAGLELEWRADQPGTWRTACA